MCILGACGGHLELQVVVSCHVGTRNWFWVTAGAPSSINHWAISPALWPYFFFFFCGRNLFYLGSTDLARLVGHELQGSVCLCSPGVGVQASSSRFLMWVLGMQTQALLLVQQTFHWLSPLLGHISRISRDAHTLAIWSSVWPVNRTLHIWKRWMGVSQCQSKVQDSHEVSIHLVQLPK